jgi:hypothetical protein
MSNRQNCSCLHSCLIELILRLIRSGGLPRVCKNVPEFQTAQGLVRFLSPSCHRLDGLRSWPHAFAKGGTLALFEGRHPPPTAQAPSSALWGEAHLGWSTPVGIGFAADFQPVPWLVLNVGIGTRARIAGTARINLWTWDGGYTLSVGGGYSTGSYRWSNAGFFEDSSKPHTKTWSHAHWRNVLMSFGRRTVPTGWRVYAGYATMLNPYDYSCSIDRSSELYEPLCTGPGADNAFMIGGAYGWGAALW